MADIRTLVKEVLENGYLMSLATVDSTGVWCADVIYVFDEDLTLYWMSDPDVRHSQAILNSPQVAGTITVSGKGESNSGIQFLGRAQKLDGPRYDLAVKHYKKCGKVLPQEQDDVLQGDSWYVLKPTLIELINEEHFGFDKQKLELG